MIPIRRVSMISSSTRLDEKSLYDILDSGFSRIPVYKKHDKQHLLGYLLVKELIVVSSLCPIIPCIMHFLHCVSAVSAISLYCLSSDHHSSSHIPNRSVSATIGQYFR